MVKAASLDSYFNTRMGAEILKTFVKQANINPDKKAKLLSKMSKDLSADNIAKSMLEKKSEVKIKPQKGAGIASAAIPLTMAIGGIPELSRRAERYHKQSLKPIFASDYDLRVNKTAEVPLAQTLGSMGMGFGPDFLKELSKGVMQSPLSILSHKLSKNLYNLPSRIQPDETYGKSLYQNLGKETSNLLAQQVQEQLKKQESLHIDKNVYSPMRKQIFDTLVKGKQADPIIAAAIAEGRTTIDKVWSTYKTMVRFAPKLSTDINAVKAFFRHVVTQGDGETIDHMYIKILADTENAINKSLEGVV